ATSTPRLSFGTVRGYEQDGRHIAPFTTVGGAFRRATGKPPFALPPSWLAAKDRISPDTPLNLAADTDSLGGNSGSPLIDREARIVGLVFDGNIQSLGSDFWFDPAVDRSVAVHSAGLLETLRKVYH